MIEIRETTTYSEWFASLRDLRARARIDIRIRRLSLGNPGDAKRSVNACTSCGSITALAIASITFTAARL